VPRRVLDPGRAADLQRLEMLHLRDHEGMRDSAIAWSLGVTPATVRGAFRSIEEEERAARRAARAEGTAHLDTNGDGTMPARWWAAEVVA